MSSEGESTSELNVVIFGSPQKTNMFEKLCKAASKYERHVHYTDVHYLTVDTEGKDIIVVTDPGLARTGGREMAIKKADLAILFYSAFSLSSLHNLKSLSEDLERKKHLPIRLICDSDDIIEDEEDSGSTGISSLSEGYESDPEREQGHKRRSSMEKIRKAHDNGGLVIQQGQQWASEIGPSCIFLQISASQFSEAKAFLEDIVESIRLTKRRSSRSILPKFKRAKSRDMAERHSSLREDSTILKSSRLSTKSEPGARRKNMQNINSKVCAIM